MNMYYVANATIPSRKAHSIAIMQACAAYTRAGVDVHLILPRRLDRLANDPHAFYGFRDRFPITRLVTLDMFSFFPSYFTFVLQASTFYASLVIWMMFVSRKHIVYTRDPAVLVLTYLGFTVCFESHDGPPNRFRSVFFELCRRSLRIIVTAESIKKAFLRAGIEADHILVARNGVDLSVFDVKTSKGAARTELHLPARVPIAVYTGNFTTLDKDKGIQDILEAIRDLPDVLFIAIGGSQKDIERYAKLATDLHVSDHVQLLGSAPQTKLALYQKAADILLMPFPDTPHYRERMSPIKMFEYMASERPIIASDLPTIREVLNSANAFLVPPGNPSVLAREVHTVIRNPQAAQRRALQAYRDVEEYTWERRAMRILAGITAALQRP